jgi:hypothetical protein
MKKGDKRGIRDLGTIKSADSFQTPSFLGLPSGQILLAAAILCTRRYQLLFGVQYMKNAAYTTKIINKKFPNSP